MRKLTINLIALLMLFLSVINVYSIPASWTYNQNTGSSATIGFNPQGTYTINGRAMAIGDAIGVFFTDNSQLHCAGYLVWGGNQFGIVAVGDDGQTSAKDGFDESETYTFKLWDEALQTEISNPTMTLASGNTYYSNDGMTVYNSFVATAAIQLNPPELLTPDDLSTDLPLVTALTWNPVTNSTNYRVQVSLSNNFSSNIISEITTNTSINTSNLSNSTTYYWRVQAINGDINSSATLGPWSAVRSFTTLASSGTTTLNVTVLLSGLWTGTVHKSAAVTVELRSEASLGTSILYKRAAGLINSAGTVSVNFDTFVSGNYWLIIRSTGYAPVASLSRISIQSGAVANYDFSRSLSSAYQGQMLKVNGDRYMLKAGDFDGGRRINANDFNIIKQNNALNVSIIPE